MHMRRRNSTIPGKWSSENTSDFNCLLWREWKLGVYMQSTKLFNFGCDVVDNETTAPAFSVYSTLVPPDGAAIRQRHPSSSSIPGIVFNYVIWSHGEGILYLGQNHLSQSVPCCLPIAPHHVRGQSLTDPQTGQQYRSRGEGGQRKYGVGYQVPSPVLEHIFSVPA